MGVLVRLNGVCFFLAVVLILGYLVARPHLGTVYVERAWYIDTTKDSANMRTFIGDAAEFRGEGQCNQHAKEVTENSMMIDARKWQSDDCRAETRLLWGW